jgi:hypothetical protein
LTSAAHPYVLASKSANANHSVSRKFAQKLMVSYQDFLGHAVPCHAIDSMLPAQQFFKIYVEA